jgi:hypothetical protein
MIAKLIEHTLIWLAASWSIIVGVNWAYTFGLRSHQATVRGLGFAMAAGACVFAAALVQRSPVAVVILVLLSAVGGGFGALLLFNGTRAVGLAYLAIGIIYVVALAPTSLRWLKERK